MFTFLEKLFLLAILSLCVLFVWFLMQSEKTIGDVLINALTDIVFAVFIVFVFERASARDVALRNKSKIRVVAHLVDDFRRNEMRMISALIENGVFSSPYESIPAGEIVSQRAIKLHRESNDGALDDEDILAFFVSFFSVAAPANVVPTRPSVEYLTSLWRQRDRLFHNMVSIGGDQLPDDVVDSIHNLYNNHISKFVEILNIVQNASFDHWCAEDFKSISYHCYKIDVFVAPILNRQHMPLTGQYVDVVEGAFAFKKRTRQEIAEREG